MKKINSNRIALIDADVLVYKIGSKLEQPIDWGNDFWTLHCDFREVDVALAKEIDKIKRDLNICNVALFLSCPTQEGFRRTLNPTYKFNRNGNRKPVCYQAIRQELFLREATAFPKIEADDAIGIEATTNPDSSTIVSIDKDFRTIPNVPIYNPDTKETNIYTSKESFMFFMCQVLAGDAVDGYSGCPGIGMKTAEKLLKDCKTQKEMWDTVIETYNKKDLTEDDALLNARMAFILRKGYYNTKTGDMKLWKPKK